ncbi:hypothetical protein [Nitrosomonas sp.]|uniref:hypothetical protein n=1 Tax=Nitrosomonas sp. TaxID=42353 RepID=UPI0025D50C0A|nr:hypothetical protein [Nitrosomonas sp.]MCC6916287.1 hypothetical protein [Nitrosomonas sp.]
MATPPGPVPKNPFVSTSERRANRYFGSRPLRVSYHQRITNDPDDLPSTASSDILNSKRNYLLLPCNNDLRELRASAVATTGAERPADVQAAIERGLREIGSLMKPVFYQDNLHTLFVEPTVTESTVEQWKEWVSAPARPEPGFKLPDLRERPPIVVVPFEKPRPGWQLPDIHPNAIILEKPARDLLTNPGTALLFDGALVGPTGRALVEVRSNVGSMNVLTGAETRIDISPGSSFSSNSIAVGGAGALVQAGLKVGANGLNIIGAAGLNSVLMQNIAQPDGLKVNKNQLGGLS